MVDVGKKAPDFTIYDMDRKMRNLKEFMGRKLVLAFFPGAFTSTCTKEMCTLRDDISKLEKLDAMVVGVSINDPFSSKAFHDENKLPFILLCDFKREAVKKYDVELHDFAGLKGYTAAKRSVFVIDKDGVVRWRWVSEDPGVEPDYEEIMRQLEKI